ncbi:hypothetical protein [Burkholderia plantarii]|uniref:hypothetical protein n=1 Tax=Burkholderia plantarii TaxID=41899 RepID=UPI00114D0D44|nr:hypothetical protein [Burkholderia plantarii]
MRDVEREITLPGRHAVAAGLLREREPDTLAHARVEHAEHAGQRAGEHRVAPQHRGWLPISRNTPGTKPGRLWTASSSAFEASGTSSRPGTATRGMAMSFSVAPREAASVEFCRSAPRRAIHRKRTPYSRKTNNRAGGERTMLGRAASNRVLLVTI